ncbi:hypothetical protein FQN53_007419 [Emmonsiellopsis sp. PD_33]|nr:hypothetical protein FQN53_007419 [Emmonsiellopsis sp. PD_33]
MTSAGANRFQSPLPDPASLALDVLALLPTVAARSLSGRPMTAPKELETVLDREECELTPLRLDPRRGIFSSDREAKRNTPISGGRLFHFKLVVLDPLTGQMMSMRSSHCAPEPMEGRGDDAIAASSLLAWQNISTSTSVPDSHAPATGTSPRVPVTHEAP